MEVIPCINCFDEDCFKGTLPKLQILKNAGVGSVHIDISDGKFTPRTTPFNPAFFYSNLAGFTFEVHLMVEDPAAFMKRWLLAGRVSKFIVHIESSFNVGEINDISSRGGAEIEFTMNPASNLNDLVDVIEMENSEDVQFLAVPPGPSGQPFDFSVLERIKFLRGAHPNIRVFVDGGVNPETAREIKAAGGYGLISASYLWKSPDVLKAYREFISI